MGGHDHEQEKTHNSGEMTVEDEHQQETQTHQKQPDEDPSSMDKPFRREDEEDDDEAKDVLRSSRSGPVHQDESEEDEEDEEDALLRFLDDKLGHDEGGNVKDEVSAAAPGKKVLARTDISATGSWPPCS